MQLKLLQVKEATGSITSSPSDVYKEMREEAKADRECFWVLHLNTRNKIIEKELVSVGSVNASLVHPREVYRKAVINSTVQIITVHNHPSGDIEPSEDDLEVWKRLEEAGKILGIEVVDNIIIGLGKMFSAQERGLMK